MDYDKNKKIMDGGDRTQLEKGSLFHLTQNPDSNICLIQIYIFKLKNNFTTIFEINIK